MQAVTSFEPGIWNAYFECTFVYDNLKFSAWWSTEDGWNVNENPGIDARWTDTEWDTFYSVLEDLPTPQFKVVL